MQYQKSGNTNRNYLKRNESMRNFDYKIDHLNVIETTQSKNK